LFSYSSYAGLMNTYMSQDDIQWTRGQGLLDANYNKGVDTGVTSVIDRLQEAEAVLRETDKAGADVLAKVIWELTK
jgi:hypothetical protein